MALLSSTARCVHWLVLVVLACACGDVLGRTSTRDGGLAQDASGLPSGAESRFELEALGSSLSGVEFQELCREVDRRISLAGHLETACQVDAWLASVTEAECQAARVACVERGSTSLGLELPSVCARSPEEATDCNARIGAILACADELGSFYAARSCEEDGLFMLAPACTQDIARACQVLLVSPLSADVDSGK